MHMDFITRNKGIVGGGIVILLFVLLYFLFFSGSSTPSLSQSSTSPVSESLLTSLEELQTIKLDASIFTNPVFVSLTDFGVTIPPENVGRPDPFLPISGTATSSNLALPPGVQ